MVRPDKIRLGDLLVQQKLISQEQLATALEKQKASGRKLSLPDPAVSEACIFLQFRPGSQSSWRRYQRLLGYADRKPSQV